MRLRQIAFLAFLSLLIVARVLGQSPNATVSGRVVDPSGAVIVDADILVANDATGVQYSAKTNGDGIYLVSSLPPGAYRLQVSKIGFKTLIKPDIILSVQDAIAINFTLPVGAVSEVVTVSGGAPLIDTQDAAVSTVIDRQFVENLPLNGRSFNTLLQLTPGVVVAPTSGVVATGQFSIAGQRTDANNFTVDGVSANFGVTSGLTPGESGTGSAQAFSALGGTSSLVSVEDLNEFRIETSSFAPEFGRSPGGQVSLTTRSGTNNWHGEAYEYFRNDVLDANDWFANEAGEPRPEERHNDFGGVLGGPIQQDKTFFFASYEGARLRLPTTSVIQVPSDSARSSAPAPLAPFFDAYPQPNGPVSASGFTAQFTGAYSNSGTLDAGSLRIDHTFSDKLSIFGRYSDSPSQVLNRVNGLSLQESTQVDTKTLTVGANMALSNQLVNNLRANYSSQDSALANSLDSFGGAVPLDPDFFLGSLPSAGSLVAFETFDIAFLADGPEGSNRTKQFEVDDDLSWTEGKHQLKIGGGDRLLFLDMTPPSTEFFFTASTVQSLIATSQGNLLAETYVPSKMRTQSAFLYGQDGWKISPRLTLIYGLRWELDPAPSGRASTTLASWQNTDNPSTLSLAPAGTPAWATTYGNFAPRIGIAYALTPRSDWVLRAGWGIFYDLGVGQAATLDTAFPNSFSESSAGVTVPISNPAPYLPSTSRQPPFPGAYGFASDLELPRSYQWNVALEKSFAGHQTLSSTYVGQAGRDLQRDAGFFQPNSNFSSFFYLTTNQAGSNYNALQLQYRRPVSTHLQALVNYTWSHSLDNSSNDVISGANTVIGAEGDYASSDFDVRQSLSGAVLCSVPDVSGPLSWAIKDWSLDAMLVARTGFPFNGEIFVASPVLGYAYVRPDLVAGEPLWIRNPAAGGGKSLNPAAFATPAANEQGNEGRNDIAGFGLTQADVSLARKFPISERTNLQFRVDAFNVLNHPNFTNPQAIIPFGALELESTSMLSHGLGGLNPLFQEGGPRSLQLSLRLAF
ncbi:MAG: TonB-dependent receptor [Candidatus Acidiferrales bacterium]